MSHTQMQFFWGTPLTIVVTLTLLVAGCKQTVEPASTSGSGLSELPSALPAAPTVYPAVSCAETDALLRRPAAAVAASVDLEPLKQFFSATGGVTAQAADQLKAAGPAAAPMAELIAARVISAPAEEASHLLDALSVIAPEVAVETAAKIIDTSAAEASRLKLSVAASALISLGEPGFAAFLERAKSEALIPPPVRISRMERMANFPVAAINALFNADGFCVRTQSDAGCVALQRELLLARPQLFPAAKTETAQLRLKRAEAALLRGEPAAAAWQSLLADAELPLQTRFDSFQSLSTVLPTAATLPAAISLFGEPLNMRSERALALWLVARASLLRPPEQLAKLSAPASESNAHLVARALIRLAAGEPKLASDNAELLRVFGAAERGDLAALAQLALARLPNQPPLSNQAFAKKSAAWNRLMNAKTAAELFKIRADELQGENEIMLDDATIFWAIGKEEALVEHLNTITDKELQSTSIRLAARLGNIGSNLIQERVAATPSLSQVAAITDLFLPLTIEQAKPWIDAAIIVPDSEMAALQLAAATGYLPRQELLIPILLRDLDARKPGSIRKVDAARFAQILLLRQPELSRERLAAARRELTPSDRGFASLGLLLFAATDTCTTPSERP